MSASDFYQVLGVARTATPQEIRAAYIRLLRQHHPDTRGNLPHRLIEVQRSYRCLSNAVTRAQHDAVIMEVERLHLAHQRRLRRRLSRYDRLHPAVGSHRGRRLGWRSLLAIATGIMVIVRLSVWMG